MEEEDKKEGFSWKNFFIGFGLAFLVFTIFYFIPHSAIQTQSNTSILPHENSTGAEPKGKTSGTLTINILPANQSGTGGNKT